MWSLTMRAELKNGTVFTNDELQGVAVWRDPALGPASMSSLLRSTFPMIAYLGIRSPLIFRGFQRLIALHPPEPHWYLTVIGTDPQHQGKGIGAALLRTILAKCETEGLPAYLEASRPENVPYYLRQGFSVVGEVQLPKGPKVWRMLYQPE
jgi:GNAT superfamily N-acetyltransferase